MDIGSKDVSLETKSKKFAMALIVPLGLAAVGLSVYAFSIGSNHFKSTNKVSVAPTTPVKKPTIPIVVALGRIQTKDKIIHLSGPSILQTARVTQLLVKEGEQIRGGQVVAILDILSKQQGALEKAKFDVKVAQAQLAQAKAGTTRQAEVAAQIARVADLEAQFQGTVSTQKAKIAGLEAQLRNAQSEAARFESLHVEGAVATVTNDTKRLAVETLQAQLNEAKSSLSQVKSSFPNQIKEAQASLEKLKEVRPVDVQLAQTQLEQARASVLEAQANLDLAYVKAPIDGKVLKVNTFSGESISEKGIIDLARTQDMYVVAEVYETDISKIKVGQKATISSKALPKQFTGTVETIGVEVGKRNVVNDDPALDIDSRVIEVKIRLNTTYSALANNFINLQVDVKVEISSTIQ